MPEARAASPPPVGGREGGLVLAAELAPEGSASDSRWCFCRCSLARGRVHTMGQEAYADFVRKLEETGLQLIAVSEPRPADSLVVQRWPPACLPEFLLLTQFPLPFFFFFLFFFGFS